MAKLTAYEVTKAWRKANPGARAEEARRYRAKYPDKVAANKKACRERTRETRLPREAEQAARRRKADPEGQKRRQQEWRARREDKLAAQAGRPRALICDICSEPGVTVFDHCHDGGHFRGWLCDRCNRTLGQVKDSPELLYKLAAYLEADRGKADIKAA